MRHPAFRSVPLLLAAGLLSACATRLEPPAVDPEDIPALEAAVQSSPDDGERLTLLGIAYYNANRHADAVAVLERAVAAGGPASFAHLYLGLAHEASEDWQAASDAYAAFLAAAPAESALREDVERRLPLVERYLMEQELRAMLAQEAVLAARAPQPRSVAVFPFRVVAEDPRFQPLQVALADMVTTDLGIPGTLQLLERAQIQALVQEMALSLAGYTDPASGARVGRLMRAEHVVQGSLVMLDEDRLRIEMAVVNPALEKREGEASDETQLAQIFEAEKQLVLEVFGLLGITLTDAEREAIEENRTGSLLAMLAYGEGLEAMDRGDFAAATAAFQNAASLDPGFQAAQTRAQQAGGLQQAARTSGGQIAAAAQAELPAVAPVEAPGVALVDQIIPDINRSGADQVTGTPTSDVGGNPPSQDPNSNAIADPPATVVPIDLDNPNLP